MPSDRDLLEAGLAEQVRAYLDATEPFAASVRLTAARDALAGYRLRFGNAAHGLGRVAFGSHVKRAYWYDPDEWLFEFSDGQENPC